MYSRYCVARGEIASFLFHVGDYTVIVFRNKISPIFFSWRKWTRLSILFVFRKPIFQCPSGKKTGKKPYLYLSFPSDLDVDSLLFFKLQYWQDVFLFQFVYFFAFHLGNIEAFCCTHFVLFNYHVAKFWTNSFRLRFRLDR